MTIYRVMMWAFAFNTGWAVADSRWTAAIISVTFTAICLFLAERTNNDESRN